MAPITSNAISSEKKRDVSCVNHMSGNYSEIFNHWMLEQTSQELQMAM